MEKLVKLVKLVVAFQLVSIVGCLEPEDPAAPDPTDQLVLECGASALHAAVHDSCDAMDAVGDGACYCAIGYAWNGDACEMLAGCECQGVDCDRLAETEEECLAAHEACVEPEPTSHFTCGSAALFANDHDRCDAMDAAGDGMCNCMIGFAWDGEACVGLGGCECVGADCGSLTDTVEECQALHASCEEPAESSGGDFSCGSAALFSGEHDRCDAMDAVGDGQCYCAMGFAWDGGTCVMLTGCECQGADCDSLAQTEEECLAAHESC